jgi:hypothetical protein
MTEPDRSLIRWVANAQSGDLVPHRYFELLLVAYLVDAGVMSRPYTGETPDLIVAQAAEACRIWLMQHPDDA